MRKASGHQCEEKMSDSKKRSEWEHVRLSSLKKFAEVSRCSRAKQRQEMYNKTALHVQSCFLC